MKKILVLLGGALLAVSLAQAAEKVENLYGPTRLENTTIAAVAIHGPAHLENVRANTLIVMGPLQFKNLEVFQNAEVIGPVQESERGKFAQLKITGAFEATQIMAGALQVIGPVNLKEVNIKGDSIIYGPLTAKKSHFQNVTIVAEKIVLDDVEIGNIYVKKDRSAHQQLILSGKTTVNGQIIFESGKGSIILEGKNNVLKGEVKGAIVERQ